MGSGAGNVDHGLGSMDPGSWKMDYGSQSQEHADGARRIHIGLRIIMEHGAGVLQ